MPWYLNYVPEIFILVFLFKFYFFTLQYCWFCHTLTWIHHGCTWVPNPAPPPTSLPITSLWVIPAPSILYPVLNIDWRFISYMIVYMFQFNFLLSFKNFLFIFPFLIGWFPLPWLQDHWFVLTHSQICCWFSLLHFSFHLLYYSALWFFFYIFYFFLEVLTVFIYSSPKFREHLYNFLFKQFYWNILIVNLQCCTNSAAWQNDSVISVYILFHILFHYGLLHTLNIVLCAVE